MLVSCSGSGSRNPASTQAAATPQSGSAQSSSTTLPAITTQPAAQTAILGSNATFVVAVSGTPTPTCVWQQSQDGVTWIPVAGSGGLALWVGATNGNGGAQFRAVVSNSAGTVYSVPATLTVTIAPTIITQPLPAAMILGAGVTFNVTATGQPAPTCQWQRSPDGSHWTPIEGATSSVYSFSPVAGDAGAQFQAVLANSAGIAISAPVALSVWSTAPAIASFSANPPALTAGRNATLSWVVQGAAVLTIDQGVGPVTGLSIDVAPTAPTTYTLTASNALGSVSATVPVGFFNASVVAGTPSGEGNVDGLGAAARFFAPFGVAVAPSGNVFVADQMNNLIRAVTASGQVTTLAGRPGMVDASGTPIGFGQPRGVALDAAGNAYLADFGFFVIRKITPAGVVSTYAGSGAMGGADGPCASATFNEPSGVAVDAAGNVYVADSGNHTIRKISTAGQVTTLAGLAGSHGFLNGQGNSARFDWPCGIAVDAAGNVLVGDTDNFAIRKITPAGLVSTLAGNGIPGSINGTGSAAQFWSPLGVALDAAGNLYVADQQNDTIRVVTPAGVVSTLAGAAGIPGFLNGTGSQAGFSGPTGVAIAATGQIIVADSGNNAIRVVTPAGVVSTLAGTATAFGSGDGPGANATFDQPIGLAIDAHGAAYVADSGNRTIRMISPAGTVTTLAGNAGSSYYGDGVGAAAGFLQPFYLTVDSASNVYVNDTETVIRKVSPDGSVVTLAGTLDSWGSADGTGTAATFDGLGGLTVGPDGNIYVTDIGNRSIRRMTPAGVVTTFAGTLGLPGESANALAESINAPGDVLFDLLGNLVIPDNCSIEKLSPAGDLRPFAGMISNNGSADGIGAAARFSGWTMHLAMDGSGNLYVADSRNNTIRMITPAGVVGTLAGSTGPSCNQVQAGLPLLLWQPKALAWDATTGSLLVTVDHAVIKLTLQP